MSELRIALIAPHYWPSAEQNSRMLAQLAPGLASAGAEVTVVTPQHTSRWPIAARHRGVKIVRLRKAVRDPHAIKGIGRRRLEIWLKGHARSLDIVLVSGLRRVAATCIKATRPLGLPVVLRAESAGMKGDCHWQIDSRVGQKIKKSCLKADGLIAPQPAVRDELIAAGYPRSRIHLCQAGVQVRSGPGAAVKHNARAAIAAAHPALQLADDAPLVVCIGTLTPEHDTPTLIDCWPAVAERFPTARLLMIGDGPVLTQLRQHATSQNVVGVSFPGSFHEIEDLLLAADVLVWPSRDAGQLHDQLEAMAAAKPIIVADSPTTRALLTPEVSARFVASDCPVDWAKAISEFLTHPENAAGFGRKAQAKVIECFSFSHMIESHLSVLSQVVSQSR